jgi:hypothetical protein
VPTLRNWTILVFFQKNKQKPASQKITLAASVLGNTYPQKNDSCIVLFFSDQKKETKSVICFAKEYTVPKVWGIEPTQGLAQLSGHVLQKCLG